MDLLKTTKMNRPPFSSLAEEYGETSSSAFRYKAVQSFLHTLGIPPAMLKTEFKEFIEEVVKRKYPDVKCSSARMILEGRLIGVPSPLSEVHSQWRFRIDAALVLLDLFETIVQDWLEKRLKEVGPEVRADLEAIDGVLGTNRVSAFLSLLETLNAEQDVETKEGDAGSRGGKGQDWNPQGGRKRVCRSRCKESPRGKVKVV